MRHLATRAGRPEDAPGAVGARELARHRADGARGRGHVDAVAGLDPSHQAHTDVRRQAGGAEGAQPQLVGQSGDGRHGEGAGRVDYRPVLPSAPVHDGIADAEAPGAGAGRYDLAKRPPADDAVEGVAGHV
ncbi:MAG: hypothetical protein ABSA02_39450 [Trebonia sp.]